MAHLPGAPYGLWPCRQQRPGAPGGDAIAHTSLPRATGSLSRDQLTRPGSPTAAIQHIVELTHRHLGLDIVYVSEFVGDWQYFHGIAGDPRSFGVDPGPGLPLGITYCARMVAGQLPQLIPDTAAEPGVRDLPATERAAIGAYIGVPLRLSDGTVFGSFCCASHQAQPDLTQRDVQFMEVLADLLTGELDREHQWNQTRRLIERVLADSQLAVALQPVVDLRTGGRIGVEALARFPDNVGTPAALFPAAAEVGLGPELEGLAVSRALPLTHLLGPDEFLAINVSPRSVRAACRLASRGGMERPLVFEMNARQAVDGFDDMRGDLRELRRKNIRLAIDDVGAGHASLFQIIRLEPEVIKIDRSLVGGAATGRSRRRAIACFVRTARDLGAQVIGVGVEHRADLDVLGDLGVDAAQGYLLGRPTVDHAGIRDGFGANEWILDTPVS